MLRRPKFSLSETLFLCFVVAVYSMSGIFTKLASLHIFLSSQYLYYLSGAIFVLMLYAALWQFALKKIALNHAYMFRSLGLIYGVVIAYFVFREEISWQNLLGCAVVLCGLITLMSERVKE